MHREYRPHTLVPLTLKYGPIDFYHNGTIDSYPIFPITATAEILVLMAQMMMVELGLMLTFSKLAANTKKTLLGFKLRKCLTVSETYSTSLSSNINSHQSQYQSNRYS